MTLPIALLATLTLACGRGGPTDGEVPLGGGTDGGATDGGATDGGATDGGTAGPTGVSGLRGSATVELLGSDWTYVGTEDLYYEGVDGSEWCTITADVTAVDIGVEPCKSCDWSFSLQTSGSTGSAACGGVDVSGNDGVSFSYAYVQGKGYGIFAYYYEGYGWYGTYAAADWSSSTGIFTYDWPVSYLYDYPG